MALVAQRTDVPWWAPVLFFVTILVIVFLTRNRDRTYFQKILDNDLATRGSGLLSIVFGLAGGYLALYAPLTNAVARERIVFIHRGGVAVAAAFILLGLTLLLAGKHGQKLMITPPTTQPTALQWAATIAMTAICLGLAFAYEEIFRAVGYVPLR